MRYEDPKMYISMFDDEDDILTHSGNGNSNGNGTDANSLSLFGTDGGSNSASDAARGDANGGSTYSVDVKTFN